MCLEIGILNIIKMSTFPTWSIDSIMQHSKHLQFVDIDKLILKFI